MGMTLWAEENLLVKNFKYFVMKKIIITPIICLFVSLILQAQYPCVNGISTNPLNPINNQLPSKMNTFFNWEDAVYQVQPINSDCIRGSQMESPFF